MEPVGQIELQRSCRSRRKVPQKADENRWIDRPMLHQPSDIAGKIRAAGLWLVVGMAEDGTGLPEPDEGNQQSECRDQVEGLDRVQMSGYVPGSERSRKHRDGADTIPQHAQE